MKVRDATDILRCCGSEYDPIWHRGKETAMQDLEAIEKVADQSANRVKISFSVGYRWVDGTVADMVTHRLRARVVK
jgi:hypothetical protein